MGRNYSELCNCMYSKRKKPPSDLTRFQKHTSALRFHNLCTSRYRSVSKVSVYGLTVGIQVLVGAHCQAEAGFGAPVQ
jgi:hypothetical protein